MNFFKKRHLLRILLSILILANMGLIFFMSAQGGTESGETSFRVTRFVARLFVWDLEEMAPLAQATLLQKLHGPIRTLAHMGEFGLLGALSFCLLLTYPLRRILGFLYAQGFVLLYAVTDELHQLLRSAGRAAEVGDVLTDLSGSLLSCLALCLLLSLIQKKNKRNIMKIKTTHYCVPVKGLQKKLRIAHISDLHGMGEDETLEILTREKPDLILIPGDLIEGPMLGDPEASGYRFLKKAAQIAPTFYSFGNHETGCFHSGKPWTKPQKKPIPANTRTLISQTGAVLLDNEAVEWRGIWICGLTSGLNGKINAPDPTALASFASLSGPRILLCHHPEYFEPYIEKTSIELTLSGHAHGGQWRLFGRGAFAPGQGILPKYTAGVVRGRHVISRGIGNHTHYPRILNTPEVILLEAVPEKDEKRLDNRQKK